MSDYKEMYSKSSDQYKSEINGDAEKNVFSRSKLREERHNSDWINRKVDLNDVVNHFTPKPKMVRSGTKYRYIGEKYEVIADMAAGYLRIYDRHLKRYVKLDGSVGDNKETHFKIKQREEM